MTCLPIGDSQEAGETRSLGDRALSSSSASKPLPRS